MVGRNTHLHIEQYRHPEIVEYALKMARAEVDHYCEGEGLERLGAIKELPSTFYKRVKERHHKHGWQMNMQECPEAEAEGVILRVEALVRPVRTGRSG